MQDSHSCDSGSIPGRRTSVLFSIILIGESVHVEITTDFENSWPTFSGVILTRFMVLTATFE